MLNYSDSPPSLLVDMVGLARLASLMNFASLDVNKSCQIVNFDGVGFGMQWLQASTVLSTPWNLSFASDNCRRGTHWPRTRIQIFVDRLSVTSAYVRVMQCSCWTRELGLADVLGYHGCIAVNKLSNVRNSLLSFRNFIAEGRLLAFYPRVLVFF